MATFKINGRTVILNEPDDTPLLWAIRDAAGLKGTKFGCGIGMCGACTVHIDGQAVRSCVTPLSAVAGTSVTTIEGLDPKGAHPLQTAWIEAQVPQCGYCQSGPDHASGLAAQGQAAPDRRRHQPGHERQPLPLHGLHPHQEGHQAGRHPHGGSPRMTRHERAAAFLSRRGFMISATAAGVSLGFTAPVDAAAGSFKPTIWYSIDRQGIVTVNVIRAELGQHVGTAVARIVADELEADWSKVRINTVDSDAKWGLMVTGGSWSVWQSYPLYSQAGAAGRSVLIEEGAKLLGVAPTACVARNGAVVAGKASVSYGDIVARGNLARTFTPDQLAKMPMKPAADRRLIG